jgi:acetylglutamate kinase
MTRFLSERGIESRFVEGLRVTTPEVVDAVLKVFCGTINHELVAAFQAAGAEAVGLSGIDAGLAEAEPLREELGAVGHVVRTNGAVLEALTGGGFLPVVACVAGDRSGRIYNVNADLMAVACAAAYRADHLIFLTDVEGVKGASGGVLPSLSAADCADLIATGIATGGMQAKLNAATDALQAGVRQVTIAPGAVENAAARVLRGEPIGTRLHSGVAAKPIQEEKVDA